MVQLKIFLETIPISVPMKTVNPKFRKRKKVILKKKEWKTAKNSPTLSYAEQKEYNRLEKEIEKLEKEKESIEKQFTAANLAPETITELSIQLNKLSTAIETKTERWFELSVQSD